VREWKPKPRKWPWRDFLTEQEAIIVRDLEYQSSEAKRLLADATAQLGPIRNRAVHRAKHAAEK
jgi:hypothetical protein